MEEAIRRRRVIESNEPPDNALRGRTERKIIQSISQNPYPHVELSFNAGSRTALVTCETLNYQVEKRVNFQFFFLKGVRVNVLTWQLGILFSYSWRVIDVIPRWQLETRGVCWTHDPGQ